MSTPASTLRYADRYRVLRRLGAGGMATVFLAEDERLGRQVAVKRLHADSPEDMARRFDREARLGASLNHPSLVTVFDTVVDPEGVLIVMEYVDGPSFAAALKDGPLPRERALAMVREIAAALDQVHARGIVHRDVKPANILLAEDGPAKLADLGIAFATEGATNITRTGTVLGTPSYMAPEQLEGREVGPAVDVYALATVAFEALSGRKARTGGSPLEIAHRIANEPAPDLREAWPQAPPEASEVLCQGMAFKPGDRPASAGELAQRLDAALGGGGTSGASPGPGPGAAAPGPVAAGAAWGPAMAGAADEATAERPADHADEDGRESFGTSAPLAGVEAGVSEAAAPPDEGAAEAAASAAEPEVPPGEPAQAPAPDGALDPAVPRDRIAPPDERPPAEDADAGPGPERAAPVPAPEPPGRTAAAPPAPSHAAGRRRPRPARLAPVALLLVIVGVAIAAILATGGVDRPTAGDPTGSPEAERERAEGGSDGAGGAGAAAPGDPARTVTTFYEQAAAGDYRAAWSLAGPGFRSQVGGFESFRGGVDTLESIEFRQAEVTSMQGDSAEVAVRTVARHSDGVDRCRGTIELTRGGPGGWLINRANISCPDTTRG